MAATMPFREKTGGLQRSGTDDDAVPDADPSDGMHLL